MPAANDAASRMASPALENTMGDSADVSRGGGKALIHPQRHNLKNRFELIRTLGEGAYGKVKLACEKSTGEQVAIKYVKKTKIQDETDLNHIRREIRILSSLQHEHIVNIRQVFEKKDRIVLVMDCALGGELYDYLREKGSLTEPEIRRIFRQIMAAVHYIHENGIVHRDLKLENIILDSHGNVKIADFGLANYFSFDKSLRTFCGSPLYASPEIVNGKPYHGPEVDVWSLGVVLYTLSYGTMPFESTNFKVLRQQISTGDYAEPVQPCGAASLIRHMLTVTAARRATVPDILNHWWTNLGHSITPDGCRLSPLPPAENVGGAVGPQQCPAVRGGGGGGGLLLAAPPPGLHHVPGARCGRKCAQASSCDDAGILYQIGTSTSSSDHFASAGVSAEIPTGTNDRNINMHWSQTIATGIEQIKTKVIQSLAQECVSHCTLEEGKGCMTDGSPGEAVSNDSAQLSSMFESSDPLEEKIQGLDNEKTENAFDVDKKPRRSILKRKGKFSGGDSGCFLMADDASTKFEEEEKIVCQNLHLNSSSSESFPSVSNQRSFPEQPTNTSQFAVAERDRGSQLSLSLSSPYSRSACPVHLCYLPLNPQSPPSGSPFLAQTGEHKDDVTATAPSQVDSVNFSNASCSSVPSSNLSDQVPEMVCTCTVDMDVTKVVRRRKGILKNTGSNSYSNRNSLLDDARKRLSVGSLGSNSSADILDLSYDSSDGEHYISRCMYSSTGPRHIPLEPGDRNSFSLEGDFTALNLNSIGDALDTCTVAQHEHAGVDLSEAKQVVQQALTLLDSS